MTKRLGIDLGSSSLGWFLRDGNAIIKKGVIIFESGMAKDKSGGYTSPTENRREARSKRRLIQARKYRKWELLRVLIEYDCVPLKRNELERWSKYRKGKIRKFPDNELFLMWLASDFTYQKNGIKYSNPYEIRVKALDYNLTKHELGRALYHLVQRRGYKDIGEKDKETISQIERRGNSGFNIAMKGSRTIAEALKNNFLENGLRVRGEYPYRAEYEDELVKILNVQGYDIGMDTNNNYNNDFVESVRKAIIWQRPLHSQKSNIGKCTLEPSKMRCPTSHPIFEIFRAWEFINSIKIVEQLNECNLIKIEIPLEYKKSLFEEVFLKQDGKFKFEKIQKHLDKLYKKNKVYNYFNKSTKKYDTTVSGMPVCKGLIDLFGARATIELGKLHTYNIGTKENKVINNYSIYDIWHLIFNTDEEHLEKFAKDKLNIADTIKTDKNGEKHTENPIVKLKKAAFSSNYSNLSLKAMCKIIPFLRQGFLYNEAVILAKMPDFVDDWEGKKEEVFAILRNSINDYNKRTDIVGVTNLLIDKYKALSYNEIYAYNDYKYQLNQEDLMLVEKACNTYYGEKTWNNIEKKKEIIDLVAQSYQEFMFDEKRGYRKNITLSNILKGNLKERGIELKGELYHHSERKNIYPKPIFNKNRNKEILAVPLIDSIKNPMFNKAMSILRRLINELILTEYIDKHGVKQACIDENTEIIIEIARELNDNNKRIAIERYQRDRENERGKYREFIRELKGDDSRSIEKDIKKFELWVEQFADEPSDNKKYQTKKQEILAEKDAIKRYQLWREQKGQCMYTGKAISITQLFSTDIEIEHTIPRSILPDSTMANLTVCFSKYNSNIKNKRIPKECPNYQFEKDLPNIGWCFAIEPRLEKWNKLRDHYKNLYLINSKPFGVENEDSKNKRIQNKHYYKMYYDYWKDKVERFTTDEVKESWVRRQLTDTQMVSKYAREFLKTYFKTVLVQNGTTTADFRKIFGIQGEEQKNRSKHTHHCIDAAVLTLIPSNSSKRVQMLQQLYKEEENRLKITRKIPEGFKDFNSKELTDLIEMETLIVNYKKDKITEATYKNIRKRGKLQYFKNENSEFVHDKNGKKILLKSRGSSIRGDLFKSTYLGKIKNVQRDENGRPMRENGEWKLVKGKDEFIFTKRDKIENINIDDVIDPEIKRTIKLQQSRGVDIRQIKDFQGKVIRHVRVKTCAGREVKERLNYKSKHEHKNFYYSAAGEIPYAVFFSISVNRNIEHKMLPIPIHEIAQVYKDSHSFTPKAYMERFHPTINGYKDLKLLKVGQKVIVLKSDEEYKNRSDFGFQMSRMYKITQFSDGNIWLKYHQEAREINEIKDFIKSIKSEIVFQKETELELEPIVEDMSIVDVRKRREDFENRMNKFSSLNDFRLKRIAKVIGYDKTKILKDELDNYKVFFSAIENEGCTPLLKTSKNNWNFLFENYDFIVDITGSVKWLE